LSEFAAMGICGSKEAVETAETDTAGAVRTDSPSTGRRVSYCAPETTAGAVVLPFPKEKIGLNSNHGIKPSGAFSGSTAKINQDRGLVSYPFCGDPRQMLLAVYDGHGLHGELVSEFASFTYVDLLEADASSLRSDTAACMRSNMVKCDELIRKKRQVPSLDSGSTAIVAHLHGNIITTACVGDSRCVKGTRTKGNAVDSKAAWEAHDLSVDQKPDDPGEKARIESRGGYVSRASESYGPARVWKGGFGIGPGLAMSRSLGDHCVAEVGVTAEPEMVTDEITPEDTLLILASDGVWEFITSQEAVAICQAKYPNATAATKALIKESAAKWKAAEGNYRDDISAIVVGLPVLDHSIHSTHFHSLHILYVTPPRSTDHMHVLGLPAHLRRGSLLQGCAGGRRGHTHLRAGCRRGRRYGAISRHLGELDGRDRRDRRDRAGAARRGRQPFEHAGLSCRLHQAAALYGFGHDGGGAAVRRAACGVRRAA